LPELGQVDAVAAAQIDRRVLGDNALLEAARATETLIVEQGSAPLERASF